MSRTKPRDQVTRGEQWLVVNLDEKGLERTDRNIVTVFHMYSWRRNRKNSWTTRRAEIVKRLIEMNRPMLAERVRAIEYPYPPGSRPRRAHRVKHISDEDLDKLFSALEKGKDFLLECAVHLYYLFGLRPAELPTLRLEGSYLVVDSAKKTETRSIGIRRLKCPVEPGLVRMYLFGIKKIQTGEVTLGALEKRLRRFVEKLWPRRKYLPSAYTFRHQHGTDLKHLGVPPEEIAAIKGHLSQDSQSAYVNGNRKKTRRGRGRKPLTSAPAQTEMQVSAKPPRPGYVARRKNVPCLTRRRKKKFGM